MDKVDPYEVDPKIMSDISPEKFQEYLRVFKQLDLNKNGTVTREEIIKGIKILKN